MTGGGTARAGLLVRQFDIARALMGHHLGRIDGAACLWQPAPGSWTVRPDGRGRWVADWQVPEPDPAPTVTIGWLTWHLGFWWTITLAHCFGTGAAPEREEIGWPGSAAATAEWILGLEARWRAGLLRLDDTDLDSTERTAALPWGDGRTLADVAAWVNVELTKNIAEIGIVHHLYRARLAAAPRE
ncbi:hypothetical protein HNR23_001584 [Nocardiopsis mwathae]|uniref:DinB-like domain-containing protein n=1 Tax=Nocardiopsis mwathae TaxID=1472723 RepID=A0A7W9YG86_9ACTN|nr:DinB family protein [Nocardiopsis mwathae]MBB6171524.1 hypothetical protein [Nocardiopsis mwathae]